MSPIQRMLVPSERIAHSILLLRGEKVVLLDADLVEICRQQHCRRLLQFSIAV